MCRVKASVYALAWQEADRHKWIESERRGMDLGPTAIQDWNRRFFKRFYRWCHWKHLTGQQYFEEFPQSHFNRLPSQLDDLSLSVLSCFWNGLENWDIYWNAHGSGWPIEQVSGLLLLLGMNDARLNPLEL